MFFHTLIKLSSSAFELWSIVILSLSLFRFPLKYNYFRVLIIAITMVLLSFYLRDIAGLNDYALLIMLVCETIGITLLFTLPIYYALLISITGFMLAAIYEYGVTTVATSLNLAKIEAIGVETWPSTLIYLATAALLLLTTYYIRYRKFGFMFMTNKLTMKYALKRYNFILSFIIIISLLGIQIASFSYSHFNIHAFVLIGLFLIFLFGIHFAYKHNKKMIDEKYERLKHRKV